MGLKITYTKFSNAPIQGSDLSGRNRGTRCARMAWLGLVFCAAAAIASPAQTFNSLVSFNTNDGSNPLYVSLVQGLDGNYYGTTQYGGVSGQGNVFAVTPGGTVTSLYSFCSQLGCADGKWPLAGLLLATNGIFYGTTQEGGANGQGTVFSITSAGTLTTLYSFCSQTNCSDGNFPEGGLIQASNGNFYGFAYEGGSFGFGTFFEITSAGKLTTLYNFSGNDGGQPIATPVQGTNGNFYGTAYAGGGALHGTIFEITPGGKLTTLYTFCTLPSCDDGSFPIGALVQAPNGTFYGTASGNGLNGQGTVFEITSAGKFTVLYNFCSLSGCADGATPLGGLVLATDGNFYGTTEIGGTDNQGTVFRMTPAGKLTTLHSFDVTDGSLVTGGLLQATNGSFYGITQNGGAGNVGCQLPQGCGTVFSVSVGLGPFVETLPSFGKVGAGITILGNNLTGATGVSFGGTAAAYKVVSGSEIQAQVPAGATTGTVQVVLPSGTLNSNAAFRVTPQIKSFNPPSGPVGTQVVITGVSLTQTLGVGFGDTIPAQFTVNSDTQVTATVPSGAKSGPIGIKTKGGTAISKQAFTVTP